MNAALVALAVGLASLAVMVAAAVIVKMSMAEEKEVKARVEKESILPSPL